MYATANVKLETCEMREITLVAGQSNRVMIESHHLTFEDDLPAVMRTLPVFYDGTVGLCCLMLEPLEQN